MILIQIGEGGKSVGGDLLGLTAAVHLGVDGEGAATCVDDLALVGDDVAGKDGELEIDAMKHQQDRVFGVDILRDGEIGTLQEPLRAPPGEEGLMMVQVGKLDQTLGIGGFHCVIVCFGLLFHDFLRAFVAGDGVDPTREMADVELPVIDLLHHQMTCGVVNADHLMV